MRRRLYLMRHGAVTYFADDGTPAPPDELSLNENGRAQAEAARALLEPVELDRVLASPLPRTVETAEIVARGRRAKIEIWPELRELQGDRLSSIPADELEEEFVHAFRGVVPNAKRFLGGETIGELFDRTLPAIERLLEDETWDSVLAVLHSAVNQAIVSYALTGEKLFLGHFEQAPGCVNILDVGDDWPATAIVRAVNLAPLDLLHSATRLTTMEGYWEQYRPGSFPSRVPRGAGREAS
jgi:broad specificity phosphatase PhoE